MGLMVTNGYSCCKTTNIKSKEFNLTDNSESNIIKLQACIRGFIVRKSYHNLLRFNSNTYTNANIINASKNDSSLYTVKSKTSNNPCEISLTYNTHIYESNEIIKKLKKLLPKFTLSEKEQYQLSISNLKTIGLLYPDNSIYKGTIDSKMQREGFGKLFLSDGSIYLGLFKEDRIEGRGRMMNIEGFVYEGDFLNAQAHGFGKYINLNGTSYQGLWENDKQNGYGKETYPDGSKYEGTFVNGKKHGKGKIFFPQGTVFEGNFDNNEIKGEGIYKWKDGRIYIGHWEYNKMNGYGIFVWPDNKRYYGEYCQSYKEGFGIFYWDKDKRYEGFWENGSQNGYGCLITNSNLEYGEWIDGQLIHTFDDEGQIVYIQNKIEEIKATKEYQTFQSKLSKYEEEITNINCKSN